MTPLVKQLVKPQVKQPVQTWSVLWSTRVKQLVNPPDKPLV
jgi:hypothetical protein